MKKTLFGFLALIFILSSCGSSIKVSSQYDRETDFTQYKTYSYLGWSNNSDQLMNDFDKRRVEAAFAHEFEIRGMKYVAAGGDIEISLFLVTEQKTATTAYTNHYGVGGPVGYGYGTLVDYDGAAEFAIDEGLFDFVTNEDSVTLEPNSRYFISFSVSNINPASGNLFSYIGSNINFYQQLSLYIF